MFAEGAVVWNIFLWMLQRVTTRVPVVADTPFNHAWNRAMFEAASAGIEVPVVEVVLHGDPQVLLDRARRRAESGGVHELKAKFSVRDEAYYAAPPRRVLGGHRVIRMDTTDLDAVDITALAGQVRVLLAD